MQEEPEPPSKVPVVDAPYTGKINKETVYPGWLAAGLSVKEADELFALIENE